MNANEMFATLQSEIDNYTTMLNSVLEFKKTVENGKRSGLFDDEDEAWLDDDIRVLTLKRNERVAELQKRKELYDKSIIKLEEILNKRKSIIENADQQLRVFQNRPELLQKFAKKNATLIRTMEQAKQELQQPLRFTSDSK